MEKCVILLLLQLGLLCGIMDLVLGLEIDCGDGDWLQGHRSCYYFEMGLKQYPKAREDCEGRGGILLSIGSVAELMYIKKELKPLIKDMDHLKWWVGLESESTQTGQRYKWRWADGGEFNRRVSPWGPGEPNNAGNVEHCVELNFKGKLNDADCEEKHPFICEKLTGTTTPDVTTLPLADTTPDTVSSHDATLQQNTNTDPRDTSDPIRRRDTKGPAVRQTTTKQPQPPTPEPTHETTTERNAMVDKTRASDVQADNTSPASTPHPTPVRQNVPIQAGQKFCKATKSDGLRWPKTLPGSTARVTCANGMATWKCNGNAHWSDRPEISDCASQAFRTVFQDVLKPQMINQPIQKVSAKKVAQAVSSLATITKHQALSPQEVVMTTRALSTLSTKVDLKNSSSEEIQDVVSSVVKTTSNLLSEDKTSTWSELPPKDQRESASSLLVGVESSAMAVAEVIKEPQIIHKKDENIDLELMVLDPALLEEPEVIYEPEGSVDEFVLPSDMLKEGDKDGLTKIVFVTYHKIADLLQPEIKGETEEEREENEQLPQKMVVSNVISVSVHGKSFPHLKTPIKFTMKHTKEYPSNAVPSCVFWKFAAAPELTGSWSVDGCSVMKSNQSHTVCQCNHLTNFAVLMDVQRVQISEAHAVSLQLITYIGCIISAVCLVVSWFTFHFLKSLQGERNSIHKNLVFCLFVAEMLFLFGIDKTYNKILCGSLAGLMHYFFLACFTWMFLEGVHIVVMIVQVFDAAKSRLGWYYTAGYGIPLVIVGISAGINYQGYGTEQHCWLSVDDLFIWSFAGPIAVILLVNATILIYAMSTVCKHSEYVMKEKNPSDSKRAWIQGALALEVLLGLTWVFGYFYINQETIVMAYIFTTLNSLQGLFIFCFHCILNKKVRKEYKRVLDISRVTTSTNTRTATRSSLHRKQDPSYEMYVGNTQSGDDKGIKS